MLLAIIFSILLTVAVILRFRARTNMKLGLLWDDWLIIFALVSISNSLKDESQLDF